MKRVFFALALVLVCAGCSAGPGPPDIPARSEALPDSFVSDVAGVPMKLAFDRLDAAAGYAGWAWEETGGMPKLLLVEIWDCPKDCERLYEKALSGAERIDAPEGADACWDGRAVHMKAGGCFVRIVTLGFPGEEDALELLVAKLAYSMVP
jgi:hypothetical protein